MKAFRQFAAANRTVLLVRLPAAARQIPPDDAFAQDHVQPTHDERLLLQLRPGPHLRRQIRVDLATRGHEVIRELGQDLPHPEHRHLDEILALARRRRFEYEIEGAEPISSHGHDQFRMTLHLVGIAGLPWCLRTARRSLRSRLRSDSATFGGNFFAIIYFCSFTLPANWLRGCSSRCSPGASRTVRRRSRPESVPRRERR